MNFLKKYGIRIFSILAVLICTFFLYNDLALHHNNTPYYFEEIIGVSLFYTTVAFIITLLLRKWLKRSKLEIFALCFAISFSVCSTIFLIKSKNHYAQVEFADNLFKREVNKLIVNSEDGSLQFLGNSLQQDDVHPLIAIMKNTFETSEKLSTELNVSYEELEDVLVFANLNNPQYITQSRERIANFLTKLNHIEQKFKELSALTKEQIKNTTHDKNLQKNLLIAFEKGNEPSKKLMHEYFSIEREGAKITDDILQFLVAKSAIYEDEMVLFEEDEDIDTFNQLIANLVEYSQKEEVIMEKLNQIQQSALQDLRTL